MTVKHTPAPWEVRGWSIKHPGNGVRVCIVDGPDKRLKQFGDYEDEERVARANAALIAAAPDLLELARQYAEECAECGGCGSVSTKELDPQDWKEILCPECAHIWAVIDRAEGRA